MLGDEREAAAQLDAYLTGSGRRNPRAFGTSDL
jgi:hypothetical protein